MKTLAVITLLHACFCATAAVSGNGTTETTVTVAPGENVLLPCFSDGNVTPFVTTWMKDGDEVASRGPGPSAAPTAALPCGQRLCVLHNGSLSIQGATHGDEGSYMCHTTLLVNVTFNAKRQLRVVSGLENVSTSAHPATVLSNGTLVTYRGSTVTINCSRSSNPSQKLTWSFKGASSSNTSLASASGAWLDFRIEEIQPSAQGVYTCLAHDPVSHHWVNKSMELLVYYVPDSHPDCMWVPAQDPTHVHFNCSWYGAYPTPTLRWSEAAAQQPPDGSERVLASDVTDDLSLTMNRSLLYSGQTLRCTAQHLALAHRNEKSCLFTLEPPYPSGEPLVTAAEATSVTLTCSEVASKPPANTTWRRGLQQEYIVPGAKYLLSEEGPVFKLTIVNVTKDDEGVYFCRSENPLAVRELEVYLTVKNSSAYTGGIIGVFIAVLIVGSAVIIAKLVYTSRHRICLGGAFAQMEEDRGDVLSLVESDDEQIFQDTVPRLPPLTNGRHTTLVQIHRIPSSDHEDAETADTSPRQQEDTAQTEEPEDLVTF